MSFEFNNPVYIKQLFNDETTSDVVFEVSKEKIYGHKAILSKASEVFKSMFYGLCKEDCSKPIIITDLTSIGFTYMLRHIYGDSIIDFDIQHLAEVFKSADKYFIKELKDELNRFVKECLDSSNACVLYQQINRIDQKDDLILKTISNFIEINTIKVLNDDALNRLDEETLIDILSMKQLSISEIELLKLISKWIDNQILKLNLEPTIENKLNVSKSIKNYIKFCDLPIKTLTDSNTFKTIKSILTNSEIGELLSHLNDNKEPFSVDGKTQRRTAYLNFHMIFQPLNYNIPISKNEFKISFNVNQTFRIKRILTSFHVNGVVRRDDLLKFSILKQDKDLKLNFKIIELKQYWCIEFDDDFYVYPRSNFWKLIFRFPTINFKNLSYTGLFPTRQMKLEKDDKIYEFNLSPENCEHHCIRGFDFYTF